MRIFVYGTLLDNRLLTEALQGHRVSEQTDALDGYEEVFVHSYPTLKRKASGYVKGKVFNVYGRDVDRLDTWEDRYERKRVTLRDGNDAQVYVLKNR